MGLLGKCTGVDMGYIYATPKVDLKNHLLSICNSCISYTQGINI